MHELQETGQKRAGILRPNVSRWSCTTIVSTAAHHANRHHIRQQCVLALHEPVMELRRQQTILRPQAGQAERQLTHPIEVE
ncbi:hypothetical protein V6N13_082139 [Hibiscus sabdariffa]